MSSRKKKQGTIQYGYKKWGTRARVFSQTLAHGNSTNEKDKETDEEGKKRGESMERSKAGTKEISPDSLCLLNKNKIKIKIIC